MDLQARYRNILDSSFAEQFADWSQTSPMDPVRILHEAIAGSLAEIETRQRTYVESLLDSLPAVCGVAPKPAALAVQVFELLPSRRLTESRRFAPQSTFRFSRESGACAVISEEGFTLYPAFDLTTQKSGNRTRLRFSFKGPAKQLELGFLPDDPAQNVRLSRVQLRLGESELEEHSLIWSENTAGFSRFGNLRIGPRAPGDVWFTAASTDLTLDLIFDGEAPEGRFGFNLIACGITQTPDTYALGSLRGEPWEEVALDDSLVEVPEECTLEFADERQVTLNRCEDQLLLVRDTDPERFALSYFYNAVNHSLVVPGAAKLLAPYHGTARLVSRRPKLHADFDRLPEDFRPVIGEFAAEIERIQPSDPVRSYMARESKTDYLSRFYATMAAVNERTPALRVDDLRLKLLSAIPQLRCVELDYAADRQHLEVFLLTDPPNTDRSLSIDPGIVARVRELMAPWVPLTTSYRVSGFVRVETEVDLHFNANQPPAALDRRAGEIAAAFAELMAPPPFGVVHSGVSYPIHSLSRALSMQDSRGIAVECDGVFRKDGMHRSSIRRNAGEYLVARVTLGAAPAVARPSEMRQTYAR